MSRNPELILENQNVLGTAKEGVEATSPREELKFILDDIGTILKENKPDRWWKLILRYLGWRMADMKKNSGLYSDEVRQFFSENIESIFDILESQKSINEHEDLSLFENIGLSAQNVLHSVSKKFEIMDSEPAEEDPQLVSLDVLVQDTDHFKLENHGERSVLLVRQDGGSQWHELPLPNQPGIYYKGGAARIVLKLYANTQPELVAPELPLNDRDIVTMVDDKDLIQQEARTLGVDPAGIEHIHPGEKLPAVLIQRDIDLNACLLGQEGILYAPSALRAAQTGSIHLLARSKGIYGTEGLFYEKERLAKNRGMHRLLKFVAEGKASSFEFKPLNRQIDLGIYWLTLASKFFSKPNSQILLERLFYLGKQAGQVREGENDIFDVLARVHAQYPFVDLEKKELDHVGLAQWLYKKLSKVVDKNFRRKFNIPSGLVLTRSKGDTEPYNISCEGFVPSDRQPDDWNSKMHTFLAECEERKKQISK